MTDPNTIPLDHRYQTHADLFDKLSKLRAFLSMLHAGGLEHFRSLDDARQEEVLCACLDYAESAYKALTVWDGMVTSA